MTYRMLVVELEMPLMVSAVLGPLARQWSSGDRASLPADQRNWRGYGAHDPKVPMWPLTLKEWKAVPGGIHFHLKYFEERPIALIKDPARARAVWEIDRAEGYVRRGSYLMWQEDGSWWFHARWFVTKGLRRVGDPSRGKRRTWVNPRLPRWHKAPEGWPRDTMGRPLKAGAITRRVKRGTLSEDNLRFVSARSAADTRRWIRTHGGPVGG